MRWVDWLKGLADRNADDAPTARPVRAPAGQPRRPRRGGAAYASEWVKVLEEAGPGADTNSTYTWELRPEDATGQGQPAAADKTAAAGTPQADPFDTYTWELHETDSPDDPWGLKKDTSPPQSTKQKDGINPYDTGIFNASWTGRFDER